MEVEKAKEMVKVLADGIDPTTGEVLPAASPYNEPVVIRALFTVLESLKNVKRPGKTIEQKQQENIDAGRPKNAGLPWTEEMKTEVALGYRGGASIDELSGSLGRTKSAIVSELMKQGLLESGGEVRDR